jgi:hypothetical protein
MGFGASILSATALNGMFVFYLYMAYFTCTGVVAVYHFPVNDNGASDTRTNSHPKKIVAGIAENQFANGA